MPFELRLPNITGTDPKEQLAQIKSFLYQTVEQLNYALGKMENESDSIVKQITDTSPQTSTPEKAQTTFNDIKSLIIKSADIVNAYSDTITKRLEGEYVAVSDFGTYLQPTTNDISANSEEIKAHFSRIEAIESDIDGIGNDLRQYKSTIKAGFLYYDENGDARHGLEIGEEIKKTNEDTGEMETTFRAFARFVSNRLSFYDNNNVEVAYISNYKLYITNVEIIGNLKHGGYIVDPSNGLAYKWVGR